MRNQIAVTGLFDGHTFKQQQLINLENDLILSVTAIPEDYSGEVLNGILVPGFVDLQVNGGGGLLFNNQPTLTTLQTMANAHARFGTTAMLPTLITDDLHIIASAANAVSEAIAEQTPGVIGVHFEGPHLSVAKKGIHPQQHVRTMGDQELAQYCRKDLGIVMLTVAPETVPDDIIRELVNAGVIVCLGHSNASAERTQQALEAGASGFTHLFNAMSPFTSREPGMVGAALASSAACGLIVDLHHVHPLSAKVAIDCKGVDQVYLVTDAMAHVGSELNELAYFDTRITRHKDRLALPDGSLAGSALDMAGAVRNSHQHLNLPLADCLIMASRTPARFIGQGDKLGKIAPGQLASFVLLDDDLQVKASWINGRSAFAHSSF